MSWYFIRGNPEWTCCRWSLPRLLEQVSTRVKQRLSEALPWNPLEALRAARVTKIAGTVSMRVLVLWELTGSLPKFPFGVVRSDYSHKYSESQPDSREGWFWGSQWNLVLTFYSPFPTGKVCVSKLGCLRSGQWSSVNLSYSPQWTLSYSVLHPDAIVPHLESLALVKVFSSAQLLFKLMFLVVETSGSNSYATILPMSLSSTNFYFTKIIFSKVNDFFLVYFKGDSLCWLF